MWTKSFLVLTLALAPLSLLAADTARSDEEAIRAIALDYAEGWYSGDAARMQKALHPELAKRIVGRDKTTGVAKLDHLSAAQLVEGTGKGWGTKTPAEKQLKNVAILDRLGNAATVKLEMGDWIDYMHMGKFDGEWKIVNVLWERKPKS